MPRYNEYGGHSYGRRKPVTRSTKGGRQGKCLGCGLGLHPAAQGSHREPMIGDRAMQSPPYPIPPDPSCSGDAVVVQQAAVQPTRRTARRGRIAGAKYR